MFGATCLKFSVEIEACKMDLVGHRHHHHPFRVIITIRKRLILSFFLNKRSMIVIMTIARNYAESKSNTQRTSICHVITALSGRAR